LLLDIVINSWFNTTFICYCAI